MLTGTELLKKVKESSSPSKSHLIRSCGYVKTLPDGSQKLLFSKFYEALLQAKGLEIVSKVSKSLRNKPQTLSLHKNRQFIISSTHTAILDANPGDKFLIKATKNSITLTKIED